MEAITAVVNVGSLTKQLNNTFIALDAANADTRNDAINHLNAFINAVNAQRGEGSSPPIRPIS